MNAITMIARSRSIRNPNMSTWQFNQNEQLTGHSEFGKQIFLQAFSSLHQKHFFLFIHDWQSFSAVHSSSIAFGLCLFLYLEIWGKLFSEKLINSWMRKREIKTGRRIWLQDRRQHIAPRTWVPPVAGQRDCGRHQVLIWTCGPTHGPWAIPAVPSEAALSEQTGNGLRSPSTPLTRALEKAILQKKPGKTSQC